MLSVNHIENLYRLLFRPLCLYAIHFLEDMDEAEDLVQECLIAYWEKAPEVSSAKSYLYSMVRNRCVDILRKNSVSMPLQEDIPEQEAIDRSEEEARLWTAVERLPEQRRKCLIMAKRDGLSYKEIAEQLGVSEHTVRNHINRALSSLRGGSDKSFTLVLSFF